MADGWRPALNRGSSRALGLAATLTALTALILLVGGCDDDLTRYYPVSAGRTWRYQVSLAYGGEAATGEATVVNLPRTELMGRIVVRQRSELFGQTVVRYLAENPDGIVEVAQQSGDGQPTPKERPDYVLKVPLAGGTNWAAVWRSTSGGTVIAFPTVKSIDSTRETVMVPAGTFTNCVHVRITGKTDTALAKGPATIEVQGEEWYAPGVGFIKGSFRELVNHGESSSELTMVLESWTPGS